MSANSGWSQPGQPPIVPAVSKSVCIYSMYSIFFIRTDFSQK